MNVDPRQNDPEFQDPNTADSERQSQFGMQSQADMPLASGATNAPTWGQRDVVASAPVYGSDDKKIGTVQESYNDSFKVKSGFLITHDHYFPYNAIAHSDPERIVLSLTSDEAKDERWQQRPQTDTTVAGMGTGMGADTGLAAGSAAGTAIPAQQPPVYGVYGPQGPEDTIQSATERGAESDITSDAPPSGPVYPADSTARNAAGPATPNAGRLPSSADTAIPMGPADPTGPTQGDMAYRGTMGPNNEPGLPDRPYNPGLQGSAGQGDTGGTLQPEQDPTSWNPDQQQPNTGV
ncbi:MAG TPA: DUF2171 domain-containing protein [Ktedonobacterales bacterium]